jgi:hypothetical protein
MQLPRGDRYLAQYYQPEFKELLFARSSINIVGLAIRKILIARSDVRTHCLKSYSA